jgi:hypothetical protein
MHPILLALIGSPEHPWLEWVYWFANCVLAMAAVVALLQVWAAIKAANTSLKQTAILVEQLKIASDQLSVAIKDVELRSKREALSMALEQCKRYAEQIIPHFDKLLKKMLVLDYKMPAHTCNAGFPFITKDVDPKGAEIWVKHEDLRIEIIHALNELESFAMYFALDLADEQAAFPPAAQTLCTICEYYRFFIGAFREDERVKLYQNLVKLYAIWKPRLERTALDEQSKILDRKKQQLPPDKTGVPIGTKFF